MNGFTTRLRRLLCSHDYEMVWKELGEGTEGVRCKRCGRRDQRG